MARFFREGVFMDKVSVRDIYGFINSISPFEIQESWDNSGLCIGSMDLTVSKILTALDCTVDVAKEAAEKGVQLIVTHHPVIFRPIKRLDYESVVGMLALNNISVISAHTNFDSAVMNDILCEALGFKTVEPLAVENGVPIGYVCECEEISAEEMGEHIKKTLGNRVVRFSKNRSGKKIRRAAVCSGSGGSFLGDALAKGCDALITGDVKHDVFIDGYNAGIAVFDAGHFHTENIFCEYMKKALIDKFEGLEIDIAKSNRDTVNYII